MSCNNAFCGAGTFCIFLGIMFFFMLNINIPAYYESNPLGNEDPSDKYYYFNNASASEKCNEIKEDILKKDKTLSELFPNPNTIIGIANAVKWITLFICIYIFFLLFYKEITESAHKYLLSFEIFVGVLLFLFWIIILIEKNGLNKYEDFLNCNNVNKDKIKKIPDIDKVYNSCFCILLYLFYIALYFGYICARNYTFKYDYDYHLI